MNVLNWLKSLFTNRGQALANYRRGILRANKHDPAGAVEAYSAAIGAADAPPDVKAMALYNRALIYAAHEDAPKAVKDLNVVLAMAETPPNIKTEAKRKLERMKRQAGRSED